MGEMVYIWLWFQEEEIDVKSVEVSMRSIYG